jgi:hypothetical protein
LAAIPVQDKRVSVMAADEAEVEAGKHSSGDPKKLLCRRQHVDKLRHLAVASVP